MLISFLHNYFDVPTKLLSDLYLRFRYFKKIIFSCICIYELYLFNWIYQISKLCNQIFFSYFWILNYSSVNWFRVESSLHAHTTMGLLGSLSPRLRKIYSADWKCSIPVPLGCPVLILDHSLPANSLFHDYSVGCRGTHRRNYQR